MGWLGQQVPRRAALGRWVRTGRQADGRVGKANRSPGSSRCRSPPAGCDIVSGSARGACRRAEGFELQRDRIDAIPHTGGRGAVGKDVAQVGIAHVAQHFGTDHAVGGVPLFAHVVGVERLEVAGPAARRIEFGVRRKQGRIAGDAAIDARLWWSQYSPVKARSVAFSRATAYCIGVSSVRHSASDLFTFFGAVMRGSSRRTTDFQMARPVGRDTAVGVESRSFRIRILQ